MAAEFEQMRTSARRKVHDAVLTSEEGLREEQAGKPHRRGHAVVDPALEELEALQ